MNSEFATGLSRGGVGACSFLALVEAFQISDMLYQLVLTICIILIQSVVIPLIKIGFNKLKEKIHLSKLKEHTKQNLIEIVDDTSNLIIDEIKDIKESIEQKQKSGE